MVAGVLRAVVFVVEMVFRMIDENKSSTDMKVCERNPALWGSLQLFYALFLSVLPIAIFLLLFKFKFNFRRDLHTSHVLLHSQSEIV